MRIWGLVNESSLPVFTRLTENFDVIATLFRLLTKAVNSVGADPDESLLDECCLLPNQVLIPQMDLTQKAIGIASPALFTNSLPLNCVYFTEPAFLKYSIKAHSVDGAVINTLRRKIDAVRHISLGPIDCESSNVRCCSRCTAVSLLHSIFKNAITRSWDQRWVRNCLCGGNWRATLKSSKVTKISQ